MKFFLGMSLETFTKSACGFTPKRAFLKVLCVQFKSYMRLSITVRNTTSIKVQNVFYRILRIVLVLC